MLVSLRNCVLHIHIKENFTCKMYNKHINGEEFLVGDLVFYITICIGAIGNSPRPRQPQSATDHVASMHDGVGR